MNSLLIGESGRIAGVFSPTTSSSHEEREVSLRVYQVQSFESIALSWFSKMAAIFEVRLDRNMVEM
jgi:hypothetical protein